MDVGIKRNWGSVSGHKVLFTVTHQVRVKRERKAKRQIGKRWLKNTQDYKLKNAYSQDLSWIKVSALL